MKRHESKDGQWMLEGNDLHRMDGGSWVHAYSDWKINRGNIGDARQRYMRHLDNQGELTEQQLTDYQNL